MERFFGTLKQKLNQIVVADYQQLNVALEIFRDWYNVVRPHQSLGGCTPGEVWRGVDTRGARRLVEPYSAWDGLLRGFRIRW